MIGVDDGEVWARDSGKPRPPLSRAQTSPSSTPIISSTPSIVALPRKRSICSSAVIVVPGLNDDQLIICRAIDETVLVVNPPGPEAGEIKAQWLRLAGTFEWGPPGFLD